MNEESVEDPSAPVFFLSYARADYLNKPANAPYQVNRLVLRLFQDLSENVNQLLALPSGRDPGFMDLTMSGGVEWEREILWAAGSCQVFVCLLSTSYIGRSKWCAREWDLFSRREIVARSHRQVAMETAIVPLTWAPIRQEIPAIVDKVTRFQPPDLPNPTFLPLYEREGMFGLLTMGRTRAYKAIVWKLAQHIQFMYHSYLVKPLILDSSSDLRTSFERDGGAE